VRRVLKIAIRSALALRLALKLQTPEVLAAGGLSCDILTAVADLTLAGSKAVEFLPGGR
jgi:hypothetical protein